MSNKVRNALRVVTKVLIIIRAVDQLFLIFPVVIGMFAYRFIDEGPEHKTGKIIWSILIIIFSSDIAGVLMLLDALLPYKENAKKEVEDKKAQPVVDAESKEVNND